MPNCGPHFGKLVHQLPGVVTLAYDLCLMRTIARWKDLSKQYHFGRQHGPWTYVAPDFPKKCRLGPQNDYKSLGPEKITKNSKLCYN